MHALTEFLELNVVDQLKILPGVGEVTLAGYEQRNLRVWVDNNKLKPLQLTDQMLGLFLEVVLLPRQSLQLGFALGGAGL